MKDMTSEQPRARKVGVSSVSDWPDWHHMMVLRPAFRRHWAEQPHTWWTDSEERQSAWVCLEHASDLFTFTWTNAATLRSRRHPSYAVFLR